MTIRRVERGRNHSYLIDGAKALGVTTALSKGMPKPALPYWSARTVAEYVADMGSTSFAELLDHHGRDATVSLLKSVPWSQRDKAAAQGTEVHGFAERLIHGEQVDVPEHLDGYVGSAVKFMDEWKPAPLLVERVVASYRWMYAGTFDLIAELPDGRRVLFDYKTSKSGIFPETALQLAAYRFADVYQADGGTEVQMSEVGITDTMAVWVRPDGYDVIPVAGDETAFKAFLHVAYVARIADDMKDWVRPAVFPV